MRNWAKGIDPKIMSGIKEEVIKREEELNRLYTLFLSII